MNEKVLAWLKKHKLKILLPALCLLGVLVVWLFIRNKDSERSPPPSKEPERKNDKNILSLTENDSADVERKKKSPNPKGEGGKPRREGDTDPSTPSGSPHTSTTENADTAKEKNTPKRTWREREEEGNKGKRPEEKKETPKDLSNSSIDNSNVDFAEVRRRIREQQSQIVKPPDYSELPSSGKRKEGAPPSKATLLKWLDDAKDAVIRVGAISADNPSFADFPDPTKFIDILAALDNNGTKEAACEDFIESFVDAFSEDYPLVEQVKKMADCRKKIVKVQWDIYGLLNTLVKPLYTAEVFYEPQQIGYSSIAIAKSVSKVLRSHSYNVDPSIKALDKAMYDIAQEAFACELRFRLPESKHVKAILDAKETSDDYYKLIMSFKSGAEEDEIRKVRRYFYYITNANQGGVGIISSVDAELLDRLLFTKDLLQSPLKDFDLSGGALEVFNRIYRKRAEYQTTPDRANFKIDFNRYFVEPLKRVSFDANLVYFKELSHHLKNMMDILETSSLDPTVKAIMERMFVLDDISGLGELKKGSGSIDEQDFMKCFILSRRLRVGILKAKKGPEDAEVQSLAKEYKQMLINHFDLSQQPEITEKLFEFETFECFNFNPLSIDEKLKLKDIIQIGVANKFLDKVSSLARFIGPLYFPINDRNNIRRLEMYDQLFSAFKRSDAEFDDLHFAFLLLECQWKKSTFTGTLLKSMVNDYEKSGPEAKRCMAMFDFVQAAPFLTDVGQICGAILLPKNPDIYKTEEWKALSSAFQYFTHLIQEKAFEEFQDAINNIEPSMQPSLEFLNHPVFLKYAKGAKEITVRMIDALEQVINILDAENDASLSTALKNQVQTLRPQFIN